MHQLDSNHIGITTLATAVGAATSPAEAGISKGDAANEGDGDTAAVGAINGSGTGHPTGIYGDPYYGDPQYGDPQYQDPQYQDPQYQDPQYQDPQYQNPQYQNRSIKTRILSRGGQLPSVKPWRLEDMLGKPLGRGG